VPRQTPRRGDVLTPEERRAALALAITPGIGPARYRDLIATSDGPVAALGAAVSTEEVAHALGQAERVADEASAAGVAVVVLGEDAYPAPLHDLPDPPPVLFIAGDAALLRRPAVAIVGTREPTAYGERIASRLARELAVAGAVVVSGMARGIDAAAHRAALAVEEPTVAVLGGGADVPYPVAHRALLRRIATSGAAISEHPCGTRPGPGAFPRRNRLIAALSRLTIVVEAGVRSGALLTATIAGEIGRPFAVVPGPIDVPQSAGTNQLARDGASIVASVEDALALANLTRRGDAARPGDADGETPCAQAGGLADGVAAAIWQLLRRGPTDVDALVRATGAPPRTVLGHLTALELRGLVRQDPRGYAAL
jgi:DNA processing protein